MGRAVPSQDGIPVIEEVAVEPDFALKLGPFSCFCICVPRDSAEALWLDGPVAGASVSKRAASRDAGGSDAGPEEESFVAAPVGTSSRRGSNASLRDAKAPSSASLPGGGSGGRRAGLLAPVTWFLEAALVPGERGEAQDLRVAPLLDGVEAYAEVLNKIAPGAGMGSYLLTNTQKLRDSKADASEKLYRPWLLSELPVHGPRYREYVDDSAWMGNLWMSWVFEFFVEFFAHLDEGKDTRAAADEAYNKTLYNHHNFIQRSGFNQAVKRLPPRKELFALLQGQTDEEGVVREVGAFVRAARPAVRFCLQMDSVLSNRLEEARRGGS